MKALILCAALAAAGPALAGDELVMRSKDLTVRLSMEPCAIEMAAQALIAVGSKTPPRKAVAQHRSNELAACWGTLGENVIIVDEDGDGGYVPKASFSKAGPGV